MSDVKICGIKDHENLCAAIDAGAGFVGFVFYESSPRHVTLEMAQELAQAASGEVRRVGLFVDPEDDSLSQVLDVVSLDMIQLHGHESPGRVAEVKAKFGLPVMKAVHVASAHDLDMVEGYEASADWILFDTKVPGQMGGTGESFDWALLQNRTMSRPWMLSGGLDSQNVVQALSVLNPTAVDVSSGVESEKGVKSAEKIIEFINTVKTID